MPKLDRLRNEKRIYLEFQKASTELERLSRLVVAYDWTHLSTRYVHRRDPICAAKF